MIVADHSKFGRLALARLCGLDEVQHVVVDPGLPDTYRGLLEAAGVRSTCPRRRPDEAGRRAGNGAARPDGSRTEA